MPCRCRDATRACSFSKRSIINTRSSSRRWSRRLKGPSCASFCAALASAALSSAVSTSRQLSCKTASWRAANPPPLSSRINSSATAAKADVWSPSIATLARTSAQMEPTSAKHAAEDQVAKAWTRAEVSCALGSAAPSVTSLTPC